METEKNKRRKNMSKSNDINNEKYIEMGKALEKATKYNEDFKVITFKKENTSGDNWVDYLGFRSIEELLEWYRNTK